jgi:uncharacterized protein YndB with AHSA1/START domain
MIDVITEISEAHRKVGARMLEGDEARVVTISRSYAAQLADVWDACTNSQRIPRWFLPVHGQLTIGGRYQFEGNAGGTISRCDAPHGFDATWEYGGDVSWIELRLTDEGNDHTLFQLNFISRVDDDKWAQFGPGAAGVGWDGALMGLSLHLSTRETVNPDGVAEWSASDDGRWFLTASSDAWYDASVAFGTDPTDARLAADRTTAFYTGMPVADEKLGDSGDPVRG